MFKAYLKIAFRHLWRNKFYSGLNILGLGVGLTASMILFLIVDYERSFDTFHNKSEHIYKVAEKGKNGNISEIAIRKVNGARKGQIVALFSKSFLISVGIAFVIACPLAWYIKHDWLQDFAYRIEIQWWVFAVAGLMGVLISLGTVGVQTFRAAMANPVESLRDE